MQHFPEVDRGVWFGEAQARDKMLIGQRPMLDAFFAVVNRTAKTKTAPG
ncbi:MAG: hypothetical protein ACJ8IR_13485 [Alphaproteobacteria bacterium]